ncbi:MAG: hypothetical protein HFG34_03540 [Eubacterium sp.]|nr:hypothetical protein [Eubacterium sp.]
MKQKKYIIHRISAGLATGIFSGLIICLYRFFMSFCDTTLNHKIIPSLHSGSFFYPVAWGTGLLLLSRFVYWSICLEPKAEGGGVSHSIEEARGITDARWWSVLLVKLTSAPLCIFAGFSLGKTGSAVEIGTMSGKGIFRSLQFFRRHYQPRLSLPEYCCTGAGAGLSALFCAPVSGLMFTLEKFPRLRAISVLTIAVGSVSAFLVSHIIFGTAPILDTIIPLQQYYYYPALALLGILLGVAGKYYAFSLKRYAKLLSKYNKRIHGMLWSILFLLAGVVCYFFPAITGPGNNMLAVLKTPATAYTTLLLLLFGKYLFSMVSSGSGLPGGTIFPLLTVGACIGQLYGLALCSLFPGTGFSPACFLLGGMSGFFTSALGAPVTGVFLMCEFTCCYGNLLPLFIISLFSHLTAQLINHKTLA